MESQQDLLAMFLENPRDVDPSKDVDRTRIYLQFRNPRSVLGIALLSLEVV